jgi:hypothetical protein
MSHQFAQASLPPPLNRLHDDQRRSVMTFSGHSENARGLAGQEGPETWCRPTVSERYRQAYCTIAQRATEKAPPVLDGPKSFALGLPMSGKPAD